MEQSPQTNGTQLLFHDMAGNSPLTQRRIRHVAAIQIRNLTPFPVRDAFASAITQPAEQPQFTTHGHLSDDLDVTLSRKRSHRISANSVATHRSFKSDDGKAEGGSTIGAGLGDRGRRTSASRVSFAGGDIYASTSSSLGRQYSTSGSAPTIRSHRPRTSSMASSIGSHLSGISALSISPSGTLVAGDASSYAGMLSATSQTDLEKIIRSRLVETFLAVTVPPTTQLGPPATPSLMSPFRHLASPSRSCTPTKNVASSQENMFVPPQTMKDAEVIPVRKSHKSASLLSQDRNTITRSDITGSPKLFPLKPSRPHTKSASTSVLRSNGKVNTHLLPPQKPPGSNSLRNPTSSPSLPDKSLPNYLSPIHRPSTNPFFPLDSRSGWIDSSGQKMKIEIWGKVGGGWPIDRVKQENGQGGGSDYSQENPAVEWKALCEWNLDLRELASLNDLATHSATFPSNTLVITLSPPGHTYYLPSHPPVRQQTPFPSTGYISDPETEVRKIKASGISLLPSSPTWSEHIGDSRLRRRNRRGQGSTFNSASETINTASWQDIFKLVTLQSCILDTKVSLQDVTRGIDKMLIDDATPQLRREVSEREARVEELRISRRKVTEHTGKMRGEIERHLERLHQRKENLALVRDQFRQEVESEIVAEEEIAQERAQHLSLRQRFDPTRTTLLSTLATIFHIELLSPPDLLYTILDVPLPIPLSSTDPAPPLSLPAHKDVTEDTVASSLGFAAQLVQLLAAYLGKGLVYPVTCIGSRSLIRDGISAMVGPRMFPLFSKGVDTYRFEYGVFLLNKDIELLMADRDLHALDMRHTLPNLKNLLLTLTAGEGANLWWLQPSDSPISTVSDLGSPLPEGTPVELDTSTPKASNKVELPADENSPPVSGSSTPTAVANDASKKARPFLGLSPLADFFLGRYPSSIRPQLTKVPESSEGSQHTEAETTSFFQDSVERDGSDDDDDRRTIHGVIRDVDELRQEGFANGASSPALNGHSPEQAQEQEKIFKNHSSFLCDS